MRSVGRAFLLAVMLITAWSALAVAAVHNPVPLPNEELQVAVVMATSATAGGVLRCPACPTESIDIECQAALCPPTVAAPALGGWAQLPNRHVPYGLSSVTAPADLGDTPEPPPPRLS